MTDHLSPETLNAVIDGELPADKLPQVQEHLATCPVCTSEALQMSLLKSATARTAHRYVPAPQFLERLARQKPPAPGTGDGINPDLRLRTPVFRRSGLPGWAVAAALLLVCVSLILIQRHQYEIAAISAEHASFISEVSDQHVAMLAASQPPQVLSSDKHTVKPWFQGKLPFAFNLPDSLPTDTRLDGANLSYLGNQPTAQLLYSVGKHHVSIFVQSRSTARDGGDFSSDPSGFHLQSATTDDLRLTAISDCDPSRLRELLSLVEHAQNHK